MDTTQSVSGNQELSEPAEAAQEAYERAAADGLCQIGALEVARDAGRASDSEAILKQEPSTHCYQA